MFVWSEEDYDYLNLSFDVKRYKIAVILRQTKLMIMRSCNNHQSRMSCYETDLIAIVNQTLFLSCCYRLVIALSAIDIIISSKCLTTSCIMDGQALLNIQQSSKQEWYSSNILKSLQCSLKILHQIHCTILVQRLILITELSSSWSDHYHLQFVTRL